MKTLLRGAGIALLAMVICAPTAGAETGKCQRAIAKAGSQFLQARVKALSKCNEGVVKAGVGSCPDQKATDAIAKATSKMSASIGKACGGDDKVCGGVTTNEDLPPSLGWPATCPDFEINAGCTNAIDDCSGIATCLECIAGAASDQAMTLSFGSINLQTADKTLNKCQVTIGKATSAFLNSASKALQKCWDARINGKHNLGCFSPSMGDGKYDAAIDKAKAKQMSTICKACGGADKVCGGEADLTPAAIGFPSDCSYVTQPHGGDACGAPINTLQDIVDCTSCAARFKADCVDAVQVGPDFEAYPAECTGCPLTPPSGACPTAISFTADAQGVDLNTGFTGLGHHAKIPSNGRITLAVSGCSGGSEPNCGVCNVTGPLDNAGGEEFDNQRCQDAPWKRCDVDADCTSATVCVGGANNLNLCTAGSECPGGACAAAGYTGPCTRFFGSPLPLRAGGVSSCVVNEFEGAISGTIDFTDGSTTAAIPLRSQVHISSLEFEPCSHCTAGKCTSGGRIGQNCTVSGESPQFGSVSYDCPPNNQVADLILNLNISTDTQTKTVTSANPTCRQVGFGSLKCLCDTCNNADQQGCSLNGDCPDSGPGPMASEPGICGGLRCIQGTEAGQPCRTCIGGSNHGTPNCSDDSMCPGGVCSNPRTCVGGTNNGLPCANGSQCPGVCSGGANDGAVCTNNTVCPGGACTNGSCPNNECGGGGSCSRPGELTQTNSCDDQTCTDVGNGVGECLAGPVDQVCSTQIFRTCTVDGDCAAKKCSGGSNDGAACSDASACPGGGCVTSCPECFPNQTCITRNRPCFPDNGTIGNSIALSGTPDPPCGGVASPTVGAFFCVAPTAAPAINVSAGLPALGTVTIPGTVIVNP